MAPVAIGVRWLPARNPSFWPRGTLWACTSVPLPPGCPATIEEAQSSATCPSNALSCFYPGGTCTCFVSDAGAPWRCTVPGAGCPARRPRLGAPSDPTLPKHCMYVPIGCSFPTGDLFCSPVFVRQRLDERPGRVVRQVTAWRGEPRALATARANRRTRGTRGSCRPVRACRRHRRRSTWCRRSSPQSCRPRATTA